MMCPLYRGCELIVAKSKAKKLGERRGRKEGKKWGKEDK